MCIYINQYPLKRINMFIIIRLHSSFILYVLISCEYWFEGWLFLFISLFLFFSRGGMFYAFHGVLFYNDMC